MSNHHTVRIISFALNHVLPENGHRIAVFVILERGG